MQKTCSLDGSSAVVLQENTQMEQPLSKCCLSMGTERDTGVSSRSCFRNTQVVHSGHAFSNKSRAKARAANKRVRSTGEVPLGRPDQPLDEEARPIDQNRDPKGNLRTRLSKKITPQAEYTPVVPDTVSAEPLADGHEPLATGTRGRILERLKKPQELLKLHLKHYHMSLDSFKKRTSALNLPQWVYDDYDHVYFHTFQEKTMIFSRYIFNAWDWSVDSTKEQQVTISNIMRSIGFEEQRKKLLVEIAQRTSRQQLKLRIRRGFSFILNLCLIASGMYCIILAQDSQSEIEIVLKG